jgi:hypothetical protein
MQTLVRLLLLLGVLYIVPVYMAVTWFINLRKRGIKVIIASPSAVGTYMSCSAYDAIIGRPTRSRSRSSPD